MSRDEWRTKAGSRVRIKTTRRGEFIDCDGCRRDIKITGVGPAMFAARQHAQECRK
ncbi:hypothetical protein [Streptomyces kanamyceticus]|uniref:hypothetical protein n=1 Tax=Streptomyces kanamyceticus TaxID=1967 RepID=UPI000A46BBF5|nr:hypothetical protein [Streptomyces kanamyceticus]